jgi:hypothetical protein
MRYQSDYPDERTMARGEQATARQLWTTVLLHEAQDRSRATKVRRSSPLWAKLNESVLRWFTGSFAPPPVEAECIEQ